ncbi:hypothetical protein D8674_000165 [Pyrus ussuriensis x Pyrus communis]|uniref:Uncharacterized protein n=1 Tax=Pyrus ussuriensis x Pyrus communis TaxID=2448454 RepID=A0A5N5F2N8_9ROSA|nr:hypothetical protein D8674_000165 [Pyrus ussuriensis x Pyrus communis]
MHKFEQATKQRTTVSKPKIQKGVCVDQRFSNGQVTLRRVVSERVAVPPSLYYGTLGGVLMTPLNDLGNWCLLRFSLDHRLWSCANLVPTISWNKHGHSNGVARTSPIAPKHNNGAPLFYLIQSAQK